MSPDGCCQSTCMVANMGDGMRLNTHDDRKLHHSGTVDVATRTPRTELQG